MLYIPPSHSQFNFKFHLLYLMASFSRSMGDPEQTPAISLHHTEVPKHSHQVTPQTSSLEQTEPQKVSSLESSERTKSSCLWLFNRCLVRAQHWGNITHQMSCCSRFSSTAQYPQFTTCRACCGVYTTSSRQSEGQCYQALFAQPL